jgi:hypothetical protein
MDNGNVMNASSVLDHIAWNTYTLYKMDPSTLYFGWEINEYFERVMYYIDWYESRLMHLIHSKSARVRRGLDMAGDYSGLKAILVKGLGSTSDLELIDFSRILRNHVPDSFIRKRAVVERFILRNSLMFGFADGYVECVKDLAHADGYVANPMALASPLARDETYLSDDRLVDKAIAQGDVGVEVFDYEQMTELMRETNYKSSALFRIGRHVANGGMVRYVMPTWFVESEERGENSVVSESGWDFMASPPVCNGVRARYRFSDYYLSLLLLKYYRPNYPRTWLRTRGSWFDRGESWWGSFHLFTTMQSKYFRLYDVTTSIEFQTVY